jgi:hypothetical protein
MRASPFAACLLHPTACARLIDDVAILTPALAEALRMAEVCCEWVRCRFRNRQRRCPKRSALWVEAPSVA